MALSQEPVGPPLLRNRHGIGPYRFFFYANEGGEAAHIHVENGDGVCKFWLDEVRLADAGSVRAPELRQIERLVRDNRDHLLRSWDAFNQQRRG